MAATTTKRADSASRPLRARGRELPFPLSLYQTAVGKKWVMAVTGIMVLGFMSRVILGHTGRALKTPPGVALSFVLLAVAAGTRTVTPLLALEFQRSLVVVAGTLWTLSFLIFLVAYLPMLVRARPDGMPG